MARPSSNSAPPRRGRRHPSARTARRRPSTAASWNSPRPRRRRRAPLLEAYAEECAIVDELAEASQDAPRGHRTAAADGRSTEGRREPRRTRLAPRPQRPECRRRGRQPARHRGAGIPAGQLSIGGGLSDSGASQDARSRPASWPCAGAARRSNWPRASRTTPPSLRRRSSWARRCLLRATKEACRTWTEASPSRARPDWMTWSVSPI